MTIQETNRINALVANSSWIDAGNEVLRLLDNTGCAKTRNQAVGICRGLFQYLLEHDQYLLAAALQWGEAFVTEAESTQRAFTAMHKSSKILFMGSSSMGKCLGPEVNVLMFNGSCKQAKDIKVGDVLMGDDSLPRNVLQTSHGIGNMYRVVPERGDSWTCNGNHVLTLKVSSTKNCGNSGKPSKVTFRGNIIDIPIEEYLAKGRSRKNILKQFHVGVVFPEKPVEYDPYVYGSWLGDGGTDVASLHTTKGPMSDRWCEYFESIGMRVYVGYKEKSCQMYCARLKSHKGGACNPFLKFIRSSVIQEKKEKFIRSEYLINSREVRLKLLAGLIDSDGWVSCRTGYGFVSKFRSLAEQVKWLVRSLGFSAVVYPKRCGIKSIGFSAIYWHVQISGRGITEIPTLEKHAVESTSNKELTNVGIKPESIGVGEYFGFAVDGNHRFLLGDFTVTHNSYNSGIWMLLDYLRDPFYTSVKLAAVNEDQLRKQLFAHVATKVKSLAIPTQYDIQIRDSDLWLGIKEAGYGFGIAGIPFKQSQETSGQLKGYKSQPVRAVKHPQFGLMSRLRVLLDESQNIPGGPFQDMNSLVASVSGADLVKIACAFNPENTTCHAVQLAEPPDGWDPDDMDRLYDYVAKSGWLVCRLDAALCENVKQKKVVFPGLQTYEGFMGYLKAGGDSSAAYSCFARGFPPMKGSVWTVVPPTWPQTARGEVVFVENPVIFGAVDLAFMGQDSAQMAVGRWGLASGWRDHQGLSHTFKDRLNIAKDRPRHVLQIDQIFPMMKSDNTVVMAEEIIGKCKMLGINPENLAVDSTGYGFGVHGHLVKVFGEVLGIAWNQKATERKILAEDQEGADAQVDGVMSEMWWAFRRWIDPSCKAILINPIIPTNPIHTQLTARRYRNGKNGIKVESKEEYKSRNKSSPDEADSFVMLVHIVRKQSDVLPGLVEQADVKRIKDKDNEGKIRWQSVGSMQNVDVSDSISEDGKSDQ
jgi:hypothetical protein